VELERTFDGQLCQKFLRFSIPSSSYSRYRRSFFETRWNKHVVHYVCKISPSTSWAENWHASHPHDPCHPRPKERSNQLWFSCIVSKL